MKAIVLALTVASIALVTADAEAGAWENVAAGCSFEPNSAAATLTSSGGVQTATTGAIGLACSVQYPSGISPSVLELEYVDNSVASTDYVQATFFKTNKNNGGVTQIAQVKTKVGCTTGAGVKVCSMSFSDVQNLSLYRYWVEIRIVQVNSGSGLENALGVTLY